jgi:hypothetical protein
MYGGLGSFGAQGVAGGKPEIDVRMAPGNPDFECHEAGTYNLDTSEIIGNGDGLSGAHSEITHPEINHAFWAGVAGGVRNEKPHRPACPHAPLRPSAALQALMNVVEQTEHGKGARGVIRTECDTPAYFAMHRAPRFSNPFSVASRSATLFSSFDSNT